MAVLRDRAGVLAIPNVVNLGDGGYEPGGRSAPILIAPQADTGVVSCSRETLGNSHGALRSIEFDPAEHDADAEPIVIVAGIGIP